MMGNDWSTEFTNLAENQAKASRASAVHIMTKYPDGKIYDYDAREGAPSNRIKRDSWMVDTNLLKQADIAKGNGDLEKYASIMEQARSPLYVELIQEAAKQDKRVERAGYVPPSQVLIGKTTLAAAGEQILQTAQEIVRQTKYIPKVTGVFYRNEKYQAVNIVNKISTEDLTLKGAIDTQLPVGHPEIGDDQTPEITKGLFSTYEKQIFADSFHYGFGMREKSDSWFNITERMTSKVAGVMLRMKNDKIVNVINGLVGTPETTTWDSYISSHDIVAIDAARAIEDNVNAVEDFDGEIVMAAPRHVVRAYQRNVQGRNVTSAPSTQPASNRSGTLEFNPEVTYYVENAFDAGTYVLAAKNAYIDHFIGPEIDVAYKDQMKPSNWEGRILFHFNGIQKKIDAAGKKKTGALT